MGLWESNGRPSRLLPGHGLRPPRRYSQSTPDPEVRGVSSSASLARRTRSPPARPPLRSRRTRCPRRGTRDGVGTQPPRAPDPRAAQPRARASLRTPRVHRAGEQVTESRDPARTSSHPGHPRPGVRPLPRSGPGRPRGAGRGLGRGDAPPAAAAGSRGGERARRAPPGRRREALL